MELLFKKINFFTSPHDSRKRSSTSPHIFYSLDKDLFELEEFSGDKILEYELGVYKVVIVRVERDYMYIVSLQDKYRDMIIRIYRLVKDSLNEVILRIPDTRTIHDHELKSLISKHADLSEEESELALYLFKQELGYKKLQILLEDPYIEDISVSGVGPVWIRHSYISSLDPRVDLVKTNIRIESLGELIELQHIIASKIGRAVSYVNPILDVQLPLEDGGHRVHLVGPAIAGERPEIVIRKNILRRVSIEDLIKRDMLSENVAEYLRELILNRGSLIIAGPPGSGKTTLLRAILNSFIPRSWKVVIIEDTPEIEIPQDSSWVKYTTYETGIARIDQYLLTKAALRSSVNKVIVIGETRGAEARVLAQALNMGISAITTFHGGSSREVITRLMAPPISLRPYHISSIKAIAILAIESNKRILKYIDEIVSKSSSLKIRRIYDASKDDRDTNIIERSFHVRSLLNRQMSGLLP